MATAKRVRRKLIKKIEEVSGYQNVIPGRIGATSTLIETGIPGLIYVRIEGSGQVVRALNSIAPSDYNHPVLLAKSKINSNFLEVIASRQAYSVPVNGNLRYHALQHQHPNPDTVWVRADQFLPFLVLPDTNQGNFIVKIFGGVINLSGVRYKIKNQTLDLSSLIPSTGSNAKWVLIQITSSGVIGTVSSAEVGAKELLNPTDIPLPSAGAMELCGVRLYVGQAKLQRDTVNDFVDLRFGRQVSTLVAHILDEHTDVNAPAPTDGQVLTWDEYSEEWVAADPTGGSFDLQAAIEGAAIATGLDPDDLFIIWQSATDELRALAGAEVEDFIGNVGSTLFANIVHGHTAGDNQISHIDLSDTGTLLHDELEDILETGWIHKTDTWTRTGNYTFTVSGDLTTTFRKGTKVRYKDGGSFEYGIVYSSSHSAGTTTVTLFTNDNYAMAAATITDTYVSYIENPEDWPDWFHYANTITYSANGSMTFTSVSTTYARFKVSGQECRYEVFGTGTTGGTANTQLQASLPCACVDANAHPAACATRDATGGIGTTGAGGVNGTTAVIFARKQDNSVYGLGTGRFIQVAGFFPF